MNVLSDYNVEQATSMTPTVPIVATEAARSATSLTPTVPTHPLGSDTVTP